MLLLFIDCKQYLSHWTLKHSNEILQDETTSMRDYIEFVSEKITVLNAFWCFPESSSINIVTGNRVGLKQSDVHHNVMLLMSLLF